MRSSLLLFLINSFAANRGLIDPVTEGSFQPVLEVVYFSIQTRNGHKRSPHTLAIRTVEKKCGVVVQVFKLWQLDRER